MYNFNQGQTIKLQLPDNCIDQNLKHLTFYNAGYEPKIFAIGTKAVILEIYESFGQICARIKIDGYFITNVYGEYIGLKRIPKIKTHPLTKIFQ